MKIKLVGTPVKIISVDHSATGEQARQARENAGLSLRELASRLGLSVGYIADMENGRRNWNQTKVELWNHAIQKKHGHYPGF